MYSTAREGISDRTSSPLFWTPRPVATDATIVKGRSAPGDAAKEKAKQHLTAAKELDHLFYPGACENRGVIGKALEHPMRQLEEKSTSTRTSSIRTRTRHLSLRLLVAVRLRPWAPTQFATTQHRMCLAALVESLHSLFFLASSVCLREPCVVNLS